MKKEKKNIKKETTNLQFKVRVILSLMNRKYATVLYCSPHPSVKNLLRPRDHTGPRHDLRAELNRFRSTLRQVQHLHRRRRVDSGQLVCTS